MGYESILYILYILLAFASNASTFLERSRPHHCPMGFYEQDIDIANTIRHSFQEPNERTYQKRRRVANGRRCMFTHVCRILQAWAPLLHKQTLHRRPNNLVNLLRKGPTQPPFCTNSGLAFQLHKEPGPFTQPSFL